MADEMMATTIAIVFSVIIFALSLIAINAFFGFNVPQPPACAPNDIFCAIGNFFNGIGTGIGQFLGLIPQQPKSIVHLLSLRTLICGPTTIWNLGCQNALSLFGGLIVAGIVILLVHMYFGAFLAPMAQYQAVIYGIIALVTFFIAGSAVNLVLDLWWLFAVPLVLAILIRAYLLSKR